MGSPPSTWELYQHAAEEVRAQVALNEARANRLTGFTALVLAAGVGLRSTPWAALVFLLGSLCALFSARAVATGHEYYRALRNRMIELAEKVDQEVGFAATPRATPGQGSGWARPRWMKVTTAQQVLLAAMAAVGVVGAVGVLA